MGAVATDFECGFDFQLWEFTLKQLRFWKFESSSVRFSRDSLLYITIFDL